MEDKTKVFNFKATIYRIGINLVVDVPVRITKQLQLTKGTVKIVGTINDFDFHTTLMPVKDKPHILYVNMPMLKGSGKAEDDTASFIIRQDFNHYEYHYPMPDLLKEGLKKAKVEKEFQNLTPSRQKDILKYLHYVKTEATLARHIATLIKKLSAREANIRIP